MIGKQSVTTNNLLEEAAGARQYAYAPYSGFSVGAALLTDSGIFKGANVENVSLGLTICAERAAVAAAVSAGERNFVELALSADSAEPVVPCGACRQVLAEFNPSLKIVSSNLSGVVQEFALSDLLPKPQQGILDSHV